jgi:hypothetical protein
VQTEVDNTGQYVTGGGVLVNAGTSITAGVARCSLMIDLSLELH